MTAMIGPAPNGAALQFDIECTAAPADVFGVLHTVTIHPDWTVAVPHDLEAERVAALFGSWSSCERFASATVPAFRRMMEVMSGTSELPRTPGGLWETSRAPGCCSQPSVFESHFQALMHEIGPAHLAAVFGTTPRAVQAVAVAARTAWSQGADPSLVAGGEAGYRELWDSGIHPNHVAQLASALPVDLRPLPVEMCTEAVRLDVDAVWLAEVVAVYPTAEFGTWCLRHAGGRAQIAVAEIRALRGIGLSARDAIAALEGGIVASTHSSPAPGGHSIPRRRQ